MTRTFVVLSGWLALAEPGMADVLVPPQAADRLTASVEVSVVQDPTTHLYTYRYSVYNDPASTQEIWLFALRTGDDLISIESSNSPVGWQFSAHTDQPIVSWAAVEGIESSPDHPNNAAPSKYQIKPGETLAEFSLKTHAPPAQTEFYAQGFTLLPELSEPYNDADVAALVGGDLGDFTRNSFSGLTRGPIAVRR